MSEDVKSQDQVTKGNSDELDAVKLAATNKRLLEESVAWKEKYKTLAEEREEAEKKRVAESGSLEEKLKHTEKRAKELEDRLLQTTKQVVNQKVKEKILKYAGEVHNPDDLLANPKLKEYLKQGLDEENLDFNDDVAKNYVEDLKKEKPYFWKAQGPIGANTGKPGAQISSAIESPKDMKKEDLKEYILKNFK